MSVILQIFYVFLSGVIFSLAIPNELLHFGSPLFGFIALIPFYISLSRAKTYKEAGRLTALLFMCVHLLSSFWLAFFKDFAIFTLGGSALANGVFGLVAGRFFFAVFKKDFPWSKSCIRIFMFAALWTLWEWFKSTGFLAYPWGTLVMTTWKWPVLFQIADITGVWGLSFLLSLCSAFFAELILGIRKSGIPRFLLPRAKSSAKTIPSIVYCGSFCAFLLIIVLSYGVFQYTKERTPEKTMELVMVQQNIVSWDPASDIQALETSQKFTRRAIREEGKKPDLVVWSESVLTYPYPDNLSYYNRIPRGDPLIPFIQDTGVPFLIGGPIITHTDRVRAYNSAILIGPEGNTVDTYGKMQLVPFAEYIPFIEYKWMQKMMDFLVGFSSSWTPGNIYQMFTIPLKAGGEAVFSTPICFEDAFPAVCRTLYKAGSEVFINITNDSWSMTKSAEYQHFVISAFRAVEMRTTLVRSTNSGYSVVVDPSGRVIADMPLFEEAYIYTQVPIYARADTFYIRFGDWVPAVIAVILAFLFVFVTVRCRKRSYLD